MAAATGLTHRPSAVVVGADTVHRTGVGRKADRSLEEGGRPGMPAVAAEGNTRPAEVLQKRG